MFAFIPQNVVPVAITLAFLTGFVSALFAVLVCSAVFRDDPEVPDQLSDDDEPAERRTYGVEVHLDTADLEAKLDRLIAKARELQEASGSADDRTFVDRFLVGEVSEADLAIAWGFIDNTINIDSAGFFGLTPDEYDDWDGTFADLGRVLATRNTAPTCCGGKCDQSDGKVYTLDSSGPVPTIREEAAPMPEPTDISGNATEY